MLWHLLWIGLLYLVSISSGLEDDYECNDMHKCVESGECIKYQKLCDGREDCKDKSDEQYVNCVINPQFKKDNSFQCAYGGYVKTEQRCNNVTECNDGSDESPYLCGIENIDEYESIFKGSCTGNNMFECLPDNCIEWDKICNGYHDCINGRDESLEVCMEDCEGLDHFQCPNGQCISEDLLCDNRPDCIDGADELSSVCMIGKNSNIKISRCWEPLDKGLRFSNATPYYQTNTTNYVLPNMPVRFECLDSSGTLFGQEWNVCLYSGIWRHSLLTCAPYNISFVTTPEPIIDKNYDPNTNGTNGCPLPKNHPILRKCEYIEKRKATCRIISPPINDATILFSCKQGSKLSTEVRKNVCINKKWKDPYNVPSCLKVCSSKEINKYRSLKPNCMRPTYRGIKGIHCTDDLFPGTQVHFSCVPGYRHVKSLPSAQCLSNGSWIGLPSDIAKTCVLECGEQIRNMTTFSIGGHKTSPKFVAWYMGIYMKEHTRTSYICGGTLITLDLVITAAHCFYDEDDKTIHESQLLLLPAIVSGDVTATEGRYVDKIIPHELYNYASRHSNNHKYDLAIVKLSKSFTISDGVKIICLPWDFNATISDQMKGEIATGSRGNESSLERAEVQVHNSCKTISHDEHFCVKSPKGTEICKGDSGSGFASKCVNNPEMCIYGVVRTSGGATKINNCSNEILLTNISDNGYKTFINDIIAEYSETY